jgi:DNA-binding MarR family transcriptional regulator
MSKTNAVARTALPVSLEQRAAIALGRAVSQMLHRMEQAMKPYGLTPTQYNVLRILNGAGPDGLCGTEIGRRLISQVPDVTRLLDRMVAAGLVERERDPGNRRFVTARLTDAGREKLIEITPILDQMHRETFKHFSEVQLRSLLEMFPDTFGSG